jgi:hypothetical protein
MEWVIKSQYDEVKQKMKWRLNPNMNKPNSKDGMGD